MSEKYNISYAIPPTYIIDYSILFSEKSIILYVRGDDMSKKLQISKRSGLKGDDGYKVFSVRIKEETVERPEDIVKMTNRSRNELINMMLEFGVENCEIIDFDEKEK